MLFTKCKMQCQNKKIKYCTVCELEWNKKRSWVFVYSFYLALLCFQLCYFDLFYIIFDYFCSFFGFWIVDLIFAEMAETDPQLKRLLLPPEETFIELIVRYGLYIGAVFQICCLLAVLIFNANPSDGVASLKVWKTKITTKTFVQKYKCSFFNN